MKPLEIIFGLLRLPFDFLMFLLGCYIAYETRFSYDLIPFIKLPVSINSFPNLSTYLTHSAISILFFLLIQIIVGAYQLKKQDRLDQQIGKIIFSSTIWLFGIITYYFVIRSFPFSRLVLLHTWIFAIILISLGRLILNVIQNSLYHLGIAQTKVLIIGSGTLNSEVINFFKKDLRYKIIGYSDFIENHDLSLPYLGSPINLEKIIQPNQIEKIIQTKITLTENESIDLLNFCREHQLEYSYVPSQSEMQRSNLEIQTNGRIPLINLKPTPLDGWNRVLKKLFDMGISIILIISLSPIMLVIAILIKIDDPKSTILFKFLDNGNRIKRVGQKGKLFNFYKFRTMIPNSHNLRYTELAHLNQRQGTPMVKIKNDPRITSIGHFLRRTSLDEFPQLFNVFKGEMSLVGPRPHLPEEVAKYKKHHKFVLTIKPGITGLAQITGRSDLNFENEVKLDTYYIENWSLWLDFKILFKTFTVVFKKYEE